MTDNVPIPENNLPAVTRPSVGFDMQAFDDSQRQAKLFMASEHVPKEFRGNLASCAIALEMAARMGAHPLAVMQNLHIIHGKPGWSAQFLIACVNASGRFVSLRYEVSGEEGEDTWGYRCWAKDTDGEILRGPKVTILMAKKQGWWDKKGSKWRDLPELMLMYRAATFFTRLYAPEMTMGLMTAEEIIDIGAPKASRGAPKVKVLDENNDAYTPTKEDIDNPGEDPGAEEPPEKPEVSEPKTQEVPPDATVEGEVVETTTAKTEPTITEPEVDPAKAINLAVAKEQYPEMYTRACEALGLNVDDNNTSRSDDIFSWIGDNA